MATSLHKYEIYNFGRIFQAHNYHQSPTQSCRSLPSLYISADFSGVFKNLEKWEKIENGLNKRFCYQDRRTKRKPTKEPRCYKKAKNIRNIMGTIFLTVICPAIRHLENVNKS